MTRRTRPPDTHTPIPTRSYIGVHQVHVVAAAVRPLALEVEVAAEDGAVRIARAAAEVLAPAVAVVAGAAQAIAGVAAAEVGAHVVDGELLGVRPRDLRADPGVEPTAGRRSPARAAADRRRTSPSRRSGCSSSGRGSSARPRPSCRRRRSRRRVRRDRRRCRRPSRRSSQASSPAAGLGTTVNVPLASAPRGMSLRLVAVVATVATTDAPYGRFDDRVEDQHGSSSTNWSVPATRLPSAVTVNAAFVEAGPSSR